MEPFEIPTDILEEQQEEIELEISQLQKKLEAINSELMMREGKGWL